MLITEQQKYKWETGVWVWICTGNLSIKCNSTVSKYFRGLLGGKQELVQNKKGHSAILQTVCPKVLGKGTKGSQ